jgi:uncharacterized membrane-anchored protein YitT (DUF2179 family)
MKKSISWLPDSTQLRIWTRNGVLILLGILSAGMGLKGFLIPNGFLDGGAMGMALLIKEITGIDLALLVVLVNLPFILMGIKQTSIRFIIKTVLAIGLLALALAVIPYPILTDDAILVAVFGGFFLGAGIGLAIRGGAVIDGTEILAIYVARITGLTIGDVITLINLVIFGSAAFLTSIEITMYAMLTYLAASRTVDFIIHGIEEYIAVTIISDKNEEIRAMITEILGRGVTIFNGKRGLKIDGNENVNIDIIYTVVTRFEIVKLRNEVEKVDPNAFLIQQRVDDTRGGMIKRKLELH